MINTQFKRLSLLLWLGIVVNLAFPSILKAQSGMIQDIDWHTDGRMVAGYSGGTVQIFDSTGQLDYSLQLPEAIFTVDWNPIDDRLAVAAGGPVYVIDGTNGQIIHRLDGDGVFDVKWSPDGTQIAANGERGAFGIATVGADPEAEVPVRFLATRSAYSITAIEWSPNGAKLATGYQNGDVVIWDVVSGQRFLSWNVNIDDFIAALAWSPDGNTLAIASHLMEARVWDANTGTGLLVLDEAVEDIAWSPDGSRIAGVEWDDVYVWDAVTGQPLISVLAEGMLSAVAWSFDGTKLAYAGSREPQIILAPLPPPTSDVTGKITLPENLFR